jgi:hypothetical protein
LAKVVDAAWNVKRTKKQAKSFPLSALNGRLAATRKTRRVSPRNPESPLATFSLNIFLSKATNTC